MLKNIMAVLAMFFVAHSMVMANDTDPAHDALNPVPGLEVGKVKRQSINQLPPGVRKLVEDDMAKNALGKVRIYTDIPEDVILYKKNYHSNVKSMHEIEKNITFKLSNLSNSEFVTYEFQGAYPEGPIKKGPWSSLTRVFNRPDGVLVMLHEWDYVGDGGGVVFVSELMNTQVKDAPARFTVNKSPSGAVLSELIWATEKRYYTLTVMDEVLAANEAKYNFEWLVKLAGAIE